MKQFDQDLCAIQEIRVLAENAGQAQKQLQNFSNKDLNIMIEGIVSDLSSHLKDLAVMSAEETGFGRWEDKYRKNLFVSDFLVKRLRAGNYVGIIREDQEKKTMDIGVPAGVIAALLPSTNPVSTTMYKVMMAIKSGNAIIFLPHPDARNTTKRVLDLIIASAEKNGFPKGGISYVNYGNKEGIEELLKHSIISRIFITGVSGMLDIARKSGKPVIYGGSGNGPAFIEKTADIQQAVSDIIISKTFDYGTVSAAEQAVVVERCIVKEVKTALIQKGGYFLSSQEAEQLGEILIHKKGEANKETVGKSAVYLAQLAGFSVPCDTKLLIVEQSYVLPNSPFSGQNLCPVLTFFVEDNWQFACETCLELLLGEQAGHTLVIHSKDEMVIREFALKKPVARVLVNTPAALGGMGATTNLYPSMALGSISIGSGVTSDNISPLNFIHIRKVGYGVRTFEPEMVNLELDEIGKLEQLLKEFLLYATGTGR